MIFVDRDKAVHFGHLCFKLRLVSLGETSHDDQFPESVFLQVRCFQDRIDCLCFCALNKPAGVDDHCFSFIPAGDDLLSAFSQYSEQILRIYKILGTAK